MKYSENSTVELKNDLIDAVKNEIVAFLNTSGGTIYVGVEDSGDINREFLKKRQR